MGTGRELMLNKKETIRTMSFIVFATFFAKILGMLRDILLAAHYGTSTEAIAFLTASRIPLLFFDVGLGAAITSTFIPIFNQYLEKESKSKAIEFSNVFINIVILITGLITILGTMFSKWIIRLMAGGLETGAYDLTVKLVVILFPMIIFTGIAFSLVGILQSFNEFNIPALISLLANLIVIAYFIFFNKYFGIYGLAIVMLIGWISQVLVQIPSLIKKGYRYKFIIDFKNEGIKKVGLLMVPVLVSTWVQPINAMVNMRLASYLNEGKAIAALDYANKLYIIIVGIFTYGLTNLIFPSLSKLSASGNKEELANLINKALRFVIFLIFPLMMGLIVMRFPIIKLVYERGEFDMVSTKLTSVALLYYSMGMLAFSIQEILNKAFYAIQDSVTPMRIAIIGIIVNVILSLILSKYMGLGGLALAASIAATIIALLLLISINKNIKGIIDRKIVYNSIKIVIASTIMSIVVLLVRGLLEDKVKMLNIVGKLLILGLPVIIGIITYILIAFILRIQETGLIKEIMGKGISRKRFN